MLLLLITDCCVYVTHIGNPCEYLVILNSFCNNIDVINGFNVDAEIRWERIMIAKCVDCFFVSKSARRVLLVRLLLSRQVNRLDL